MHHMALTFTCFLLLALGCSDRDDPPAGADAGSGSDSGMTTMDAGTRDSGGDEDAAAAPDAATDPDAAEPDAATDPDSGPPAVDAGGPPGPAMCSPGPCPPTCFRAVSCVTACGGPVVECGCCDCAPGSIDTIICPPGTDS